MKYYTAFLALVLIFILVGAPSYNPGQGTQPTPIATTSGASFFYHDGTLAGSTSGVSDLDAASNANYALVQPIGGDIRWYALSGVSPNRSQGFQLVDGEYLSLYSRAEVEHFAWILDEDSSGVTLYVLTEVQ